MDQREIDMMMHLEHENIVRYIDHYQPSPSSIYVVFEYVENGSLLDVVQRFGRFPERLAACFIAQVCHALVYLASRNIVHRDIKGTTLAIISSMIKRPIDPSIVDAVPRVAANILITNSGIVKLADFGVATNASHRERMRLAGMHSGYDNTNTDVDDDNDAHDAAGSPFSSTFCEIEIERSNDPTIPFELRHSFIRTHSNVSDILNECIEWIDHL